GTGASGEIRVTRPTMNVSSIASPTTTMCAPGNAAIRREARSLASGGSSIICTPRGSAPRESRLVVCRCERQRDEDQEQHEELGIAEVVFEQAGSEHGAHGGE